MQQPRGSSGTTGLGQHLIGVGRAPLVPPSAKVVLRQRGEHAPERPLVQLLLEGPERGVDPAAKPSAPPSRTAASSESRSSAAMAARPSKHDASMPASPSRCAERALSRSSAFA